MKPCAVLFVRRIPMLKIQATVRFTRGIVIGPAYVVKEEVIGKPVMDPSRVVDQAVEKARFERAVKEVSRDLEKLALEHDVFAAHLAIVQDPTLIEEVVAHIEAGKTAEVSLDETIEGFKLVFQVMDNEYMRERADDIEDIGNRLMAALLQKSLRRFPGLTEPSVIVARDLLPSDTANLDASLVLGFITAEGGVSSHVAIMAKNRGIPALIGVPEAIASIQTGDLVAFDAETGEIYIHPDESIQADFSQRAKELKMKEEALLERASSPVVSRDGKTIRVYCNIGSLEELGAAMPYAPDGVGLFRSEFLFMDSDHFPTEEEQFIAYREASEKVGKEITIRTLDIGGDKALSYFTFDNEDNPFLGWRAIRMTLDMPDLFCTQLRAILRASAYGSLRIMFPMITSLHEFERAKALTEECMLSLKKENIAFDEHIPLGIMVETPAAVFMAEELAKAVDFFSIGTNDLTQYVLAVDRGNEKIKRMFNSFHPAVLRAIAHVIDSAHKAGIEVGMCGEMAGDLRATEILLGLGLDEFSMSAQVTPDVKEKIRGLNVSEAAEKAKIALAMSDVDEIESYLAGG